MTPTLAESIAYSQRATEYDRPVTYTFRVPQGPRGHAMEAVLNEWMRGCIQAEMPTPDRSDRVVVPGGGKGRVNG